MIGMAIFVVVWLVCMFTWPLWTMGITMAVTIFGGIFLTSGGGDYGHGGRWGDSGWGGGGNL